MNIFVLDRDPVKAARYNCNRHCVKMVVEIAQMLSTARILNGLNAPYRKTHENHPMSKWVRTSRENYDWAHKHMSALLDEYERRYHRVHLVRTKCESALKDSSFLPGLGLTQFAQTMPEEYRDEDPVKAYRTFYIKDKSRFAKWPDGEIPDWFIEGINP